MSVPKEGGAVKKVGIVITNSAYDAGLFRDWFYDWLMTDATEFTEDLDVIELDHAPASVRVETWAEAACYEKDPQTREP